MKAQLWNLMKKGPDAIWTASEYSDTAYDNMPRIIMVEYVQQYGQLVTSLNLWETKAETKGDPYKGLYVGKKTGNVYILPYFTETNHEIGQSWEESTGSIDNFIKQGTDLIEKAGKIAFPSAGIVKPKSYAGAQDFSYTFKFSLLNTIHRDDYVTNRKFLRELIGRNLHIQQNMLSVTPPCIYEVLIPGIRFSPAAVVSNLIVSNKGTLNNLEGLIVPDAWEVTITIRELLNESQNIFEQGWDSGTGDISTFNQNNQATVDFGKHITVKVVDTPANIAKGLGIATSQVLNALGIQGGVEEIPE